MSTNQVQNRQTEDKWLLWRVHNFVNFGVTDALKLSRYILRSCAMFGWKDTFQDMEKVNNGIRLVSLGFEGGDDVFEGASYVAKKVFAKPAKEQTCPAKKEKKSVTDVALSAITRVSVVLLNVPTTVSVFAKEGSKTKVWSEHAVLGMWEVVNLLLVTMTVRGAKKAYKKMQSAEADNKANLEKEYNKAWYAVAYRISDSVLTTMEVLSAYLIPEVYAINKVVAFAWNFFGVTASLYTLGNKGKEYAKGSSAISEACEWLQWSAEKITNAVIYSFSKLCRSTKPKTA